MNTQPRLTRNQDMVFRVLVDAKTPLSAYTILDQVREFGIRAPLQIYRALDKLQGWGMVHRLESLNAFVACARADCQRHEMVAFAICDKCRHVSEFSDAQVKAHLDNWVGDKEFLANQTAIEIRGTCRACAR